MINIHYNSDTGEFLREGRKVGTITKDGYLRIKVDAKSYLAHRLAWYLHYGVWPTQMLDHINRIRIDNRIINLREVDYRLSNQNRTNFNWGASYHNKAKKWIAQIRVNGVDEYLGLFEEESDAQDAYKARLAEVKDEEYLVHRY